MKHQAMNPYLPLWEYVPDGTEPGTKMFDPGVLVDEDGRVFLYIGFCPTPDFPWALKLGKYSLGFELEPDMHTIKAGPFEVLPGCQATARPTASSAAVRAVPSPSRWTPTAGSIRPK